MATGRIVRRIPFDKGEITAMSASADGLTLYCVANHSVWATPVSGDVRAIRRICEGDGVSADPNGEFLAVVVQKEIEAKLYRVPLKWRAPQGSCARRRPEAHAPLGHALTESRRTAAEGAGNVEFVVLSARINRYENRAGDAYCQRCSWRSLRDELDA